MIAVYFGEAAYVAVSCILFVQMILWWNRRDIDKAVAYALALVLMAICGVFAQAIWGPQ